MKKRPNILLITIDCLRADHVSCLGYEKKTTPNIDKLAEEGVLFKNAISVGSATHSSFPAILTSTFPLMFPDYPKISRERETIAEILKKNGYITAAFHCNPFLSKIYGYHRGFKNFSYLSAKVDRLHKQAYGANKKNNSKKSKKTGDLRVVEKLKNILKRNKILYETVRFLYKPIRKTKFEKKRIKRILYKTLEQFNPPYVRAKDLNEEVIKWLRKNHNARFFIWVHYLDPHFPYFPLRKYHKLNYLQVGIANSNLYQAKTSHLLELYDAEIKYVDNEVGRLLQNLKELEIYNDTDIILTSDHGEEFGEHGKFYHKCLYEEVIRVPLIVKSSSLPKRKFLDTPSSLIDITPTILDLVSIKSPDSFYGKSLREIIYGDRKNENRKLISERLVKNGKQSLSIEEGKRKIAVRDGKWKFIYDEESGSRELFDLENDSKERSNLFQKKPKISKQLEKKVREHIDFEIRSVKTFKEKEKVRKLKSKLKKPKDL